MVAKHFPEYVQISDILRCRLNIESQLHKIKSPSTFWNDGDYSQQDGQTNHVIYFNIAAKMMADCLPVGLYLQNNISDCEQAQIRFRWLFLLF